MSLLFRKLRIDEIDFRVQSIDARGVATILAYKDARVDMSMLDEKVGPYNWQKDYKVIDDNLYCGIGILVRDEDTNESRWIWKWDVGTSGDMEKEKSAASDSFKRSCFNWGIGRELYDFPIIKIALTGDETYKGNDGKLRQGFGLNLRDWSWSVDYNTDGDMVSLIATDTSGKQRFSWKKGEAVAAPVGRNTAAFPAPAARQADSPATASTGGSEKEASPKQVSYLQKLVGGLTPSPEKEAYAKEVMGGISAARASELIELLKN
jgi:hypothetical protein